MTDVDDLHLITDDEWSWNWVRPILQQFIDNGYKVTAFHGSAAFVKNNIDLYLYLFEKIFYIRSPISDIAPTVVHWNDINKFIFKCNTYEQLMMKCRQKDIEELLENL